MARLNENENENENEGTGSRAGLFAGARYNTHKILRQAFDPNDQVLSVSPGRSRGYEAMAGWDAEDNGWVYIVDFMRMRPTWFDDLLKIARDTWVTCDLSNDTMLAAALRDIVDAAGEREDRFAEILHQQDAEGCISYWVSMLRIDPAKHAATYRLIRMARKLGEMIVMALKARFNAPRASQICPVVIPMFDPPRTATYPAGHALQSYLISYFLHLIMPHIPQSWPPEATATKRAWKVPHQGLFALARRVADNRVIAGVHFDIDCEAGFLIAAEVYTWFKQWDDMDPTDPEYGEVFCNFGRLLEAARDEWPQYN